MTICRLINEITSSNMLFDTPEGSDFLNEKLDLIRYRAERMESRLVDYCNATEVLNKINTGK